MDAERLKEAVEHLRENLGGRLLIADLADSVADVCRIILDTQGNDLPAWATTRLTHIYRNMQQTSKLCRMPRWVRD